MLYFPLFLYCEDSHTAGCCHLANNLRFRKLGKCNGIRPNITSVTTFIVYLNSVELPFG